ncbi:LysR family transcriptional regulator [Burkholderia gladioli]|uniref:LysR family transcriptional regulator n=1 Tax=Burkholderia gladioli TaxID=28095 RepID=UPI003C7BD384
MIERLEDIGVFVRTADNGSLSAAARALDITPAVASAALKRLEAALGTRLLTRSTRNLRLTSDGERYLEYARGMLAAAEAGRTAIAAGRHTIGGEVSLSVPSDLGRNLLFGWLDAFLAEHPAVRLNVRLSDRIADLYRQPVDLAVRYGPPHDSALVALPLAPDNRRVLCAAPRYFAEHGMPRTPAELASHNCLRLALGDTIHQQWTFFDAAGEAHPVKVSGDRVADDGELVHRWALAGHGLTYKSRLDVLASLRAGTLVQALADHQGEPAPLHLVTTHRTLISPTVTALRDALQARVRDYLDAPSA